MTINEIKTAAAAFLANEPAAASVTYRADFGLVMVCRDGSMFEVDADGNVVAD